MNVTLLLINCFFDFNFLLYYCFDTTNLSEHIISYTTSYFWYIN